MQVVANVQAMSTGKVTEPMSPLLVSAAAVITSGEKVGEANSGCVVVDGITAFRHRCLILHLWTGEVLMYTEVEQQPFGVRCPRLT